MAAAPSDTECVPVIELTGVFLSFRGNPILRGLDLTVPAGNSLAILGQSGTGKSVLLKVILGLLAADQGRVRIFGTDATRLSERGWEPLRRRSGMLFQGGALFDSMTVADNVAFPLRERGFPRERIGDLVEERLEWVGLAGKGTVKPVELSGGMRKRVALARTIVTDPELTLYDEPTTGLDPVTGKKIAELIRDLNGRLGSTSIVVTHDLLCASMVADRWAFIGGGRILADGSPADLRHSGPPELKEFLEAGMGLAEPEPVPVRKAAPEG
jgi:phospholipid/cholesterol/gamma-HCH transport system ATP-binding protein